MIKLFTLLGMTGFLTFSSLHFSPMASNDKIEAEVLKWYSWEEAVIANQENPKKIFVDVYTDWCGWCKRMDNTTFKDPKVVKYLNENFYPVKLDAEMKEDIVFQNHTFKFTKEYGRRGIHNLAFSLLEGRMSYPSYVFLNEEFQRILIAPGYQPASDFVNVLTFTKDEFYKNTSWEDYLKTVGKK